jgi:hypothetical protein
MLHASPIKTRCLMSEVIYEIVEHDGGWAYKVDGVFSEPFPTHAAALYAARAAAAEQRVPGHSEVIEYGRRHGSAEYRRQGHQRLTRGSDQAPAV